LAVQFLCRTLFLLVVPAALGACGVPKLVTPYRMEIQQGNYVSQDMVSQLKTGMTPEQVRFVMGTPLVADIFHADRWDYVYYRDVQGRGREARKIALVFEAGRLARVVGDVTPAAAQEAVIPEGKVAEPLPVSDRAPAESTPLPDKKP
jgi:outer membrane protein assembly factor BamE